MTKLKKQLGHVSGILVSMLVCFLCLTNVAIAQDDDRTLCPYFNVFSTDTTDLQFSLLSTDVEATISGVIANVVVEQTYFNAGETPIDATYVFPMSTNAAVYSMQMIVNDRVINAVIKRKDEAQTIFDNADDAGLTASLLEQERPNVFQMSIANIQAFDSLKVRMVYTELLTPNNGVYQFVFPNIVAPRFTVNGEKWVQQAEKDLIPLSQTELNIDLKINAGMPLEAQCKSHNVTFDYTGRSVQTTLATNPEKDFIVDYTLHDNHIETGLLLYEGEEENFFLSMIQPAKPDAPFDSPRREYIFIMDVSGSMKGNPLDVSKELITNLLTDLDEEDKFNIVFFAGGSNVLSPNSLAVTSENIDLAFDMINSTNAGGGTYLLNAMDLALKMEGTEDYSRTFVILTDGHVTVEKEAFEMIRENLNEANFFAFGIGSSVNRYIIEGIAYMGEGEPFVVTDMADAHVMADTFREYIEKPTLTNIEARFSGIDVYDIEPISIPDVFAERPIIIYGKYNGAAQGTVTITGDYAGAVVSSSLDFAQYADNKEDNIALKYLWARKKIKLMSDYGIGSNELDDISIEEEITQLGLKYSLVTEYTSFVAVDSNAVANTSDDPSNDIMVSTMDNMGLINATIEKEVIQILGTITRVGDKLHIKLDYLPATFMDLQNLSLEIRDSNGKTLHIHHIQPNELGKIISLSLDQLPSGFYLVSLLNKSEVLDTEKFIISY